MMFTRPGADHTPSGRYPKESMNRSSARRAAASRSGAAESWTVVAASCAEPLLVESSGRPASAAVVMGFLPELWGRSGRQRIDRDHPGAMRPTESVRSEERRGGG